MVAEKKMLPLLVSVCLPWSAGEEVLRISVRIQNDSAVSAQLSSAQLRVISAKTLPLSDTDLVISVLLDTERRKMANCFQSPWEEQSLTNIPVHL